MQPLPLPLQSLRGVRALLNGFSQIFLLGHPGCGLLVIIALALGAPDLLPGALLGGLSSMWVAQRRGYPQADIELGLYGYNGILLGLLIGTQFHWSPAVPLLIALGAGLSSLVLAPWRRRQCERQWLPALTFPFVTLGWLLVWLAAPLQLQLQAPSSPFVHGLDWSNGLTAVARGLGQVVFLDQPLAGLCLLLGLVIADRRAALWALLGSTGGLALAVAQGWPQASALAGLYGYNGTLAALALSQVNRHPWLPWLPWLGIALAVLLQSGFTCLGLAPLTMPFILACWLIQAGQRLLRQAG